MKSVLIFIGGLVAGILVTFFILLAISISFISNNSNNEVQVQYIEIKGKNGNVTVHTGMSKDSVQILVGKPDNLDLIEIGHTHHENWGYKLKNEYASDLIIEFEDGKLNGVHQKSVNIHFVSLI